MKIALGSPRSSQLLILAALAFVGAGGAAVQGKGTGVEVRAVSPSLQESVPGSVLSLSFQVSNPGQTEQELVEALVLPPGWQAIIPPSRFVLGRLESTSRITAITVPQGARAGHFEITYSVQGQANPAIRDSETVAVQVPAISSLSLVVEEKPDYVVAGRPFDVGVRLTNGGNAPARVRINAESRMPGTHALVDHTEVDVPSGGSQALKITVSTDPKARRQDTQYVVVRAVDEKVAQSIAALTIAMNVYPRASAANEMQLTIPTELSLSTTAGGGATGLDGAWQGAGWLDEGRTRHVEFLLQKTNVSQDNQFGLRNELHLNYASPTLDVRLGDQAYGLSPLTQDLSYGRGAGVDYRTAGRTSLGAYLLGPAPGSSVDTSAGAYLRYALSPRLWAKLNMLSGPGPVVGQAPGGRAATWSAEAGWAVIPHSNLHLEYGRSTAEAGGNGSGSAYRVEFAGSASKSIQYNLTRSHADPDFAGYLRDSDQNNASLAVSLSRHLNGNLSYSTWATNLDLRPDEETAPRERLFQMNLQGALPAHWYGSLGWQDLRREDQLNLVEDDARERALNLTVGRSVGKLAYNMEYSIGEREDLLLHRTGQVQDLKLFAALNVSPSESFTVYAGRGQGDATSSLLGGGNFFGASTAWHPAAPFTLQGYVTASSPSDSGAWTSQVDLSARYLLPNACSLSLRVVGSNFQASAHDFRTLVCYTIPINLPVGVRKSVGQVKGRIYDPALKDKAGVPDAVLMMNGMAAVTDAHGSFRFPPMPPGKYALSIDRKSIGLGRMPDCQSPLLVEVTPGKTTTIEIGIVPAASLSGTVRIVQAEPSGEHSAPVLLGDPTVAADSRVVSNVLVELSNGVDVMRRVTNSSGEYLFDTVQPGKWRFKVYEDNIPAYHRLKPPPSEVVLEPAKRTVIDVEVEPISRQIQMIDDGGDTVVTATSTGAHG